MTFPEHCLLCLELEFLVTNQSRCLTDPASRYQKTYGLMMLSTKELKNPLAQGQNNQSQHRGLLTATVSAVVQLWSIFTQHNMEWAINYEWVYALSDLVVAVELFS